MNLQAYNLSLQGRLDKVLCTLHRGGVTAICGPNGAGKSSLLGCLAGLIQPDAGHALLGGRPIPELGHQARAQAIGYLPQAPEVAWDLSVEALVALGRLPWKGAAPGDTVQAIDAAIATMDLEAVRSRPVSRLSGGERARALMARVLATQPAWLLADEPLASLDLGHAAAMVDSFRAQAQGGRGVVLVLHDLAMAMNHADRVIVLDHGRIVADGSPTTALSAPVIAQVWKCQARWLGEPGARALSLLPG